MGFWDSTANEMAADGYRTHAGDEHVPPPAPEPIDRTGQTKLYTGVTVQQQGLPNRESFEWVGSEDVPEGSTPHLDGLQNKAWGFNKAVLRIFGR